MTTQSQHKHTPAFADALSPRMLGQHMTATDIESEHAVVRSMTIVLPALNEEQALPTTLRSTLDACDHIRRRTGLSEVKITVVNDGSTDKTQSIAESFSEVHTIQFPTNRGYGAALKAGFAAADTDLVAFMDADGTLQAESFIPLIETLVDQQADMVLGARLSPDSDMPKIRHLGNWMFARLLGFISGEPITDCASGMRVIRRTALKHLMPLPDGLHFTPAMSSIALLDARMTVREVPVPYAQRVGKSKLSVIRDGFRFLGMILLMGCFYNPVKCAALGAGLLTLMIASLWALGWQTPLLIGGTAVAIVFTACMSIVCRQAVKALIVAPGQPTSLERILDACTTPRHLAVVSVVSFMVFACGATMSIQGTASTWITTASTVALCISVCLGLLSVGLRMLRLIRQKLEALVDDPYSNQRRNHSEQ